MDWNNMYDGNNQPSYDDFGSYIENSLWGELNSYLQQTYAAKPQMAYSNCSMQRGWNVKYKKGGKSLCKLYPMQGYFIALVVIGAKEAAAADLLIRLCSSYTQNLYEQTNSSNDSKWLMVEIRSVEILQDVKNLIHLRVKSSTPA
ncbi:DUF3788 domain-containing protein [Desulfosporosinus fructosivorans]